MQTRPVLVNIDTDSLKKELRSIAKGADPKHTDSSKSGTVPRISRVLSHTKNRVLKRGYAQDGIRIRVAAVTGLHDRPLHYLGISHAHSTSPASRSRTGDIAVAAQLPSSGKLYYSRALYQSELRRALRRGALQYTTRLTL
jgi:hypothetical protein